ncbi:MAG: DUF1924 domain-containing protein [Candidatus Methylumidiphilus sp.]
MRALPLLFFLSACSCTALADQPQDLLTAFTAMARQANPSFSGFSASQGEQFFKDRHQGDWSCSTCHTTNPAAVGQHTVTGKRIEPMAPSANPQRFTSREKVDKWFRRNCNDVLNRECTLQEKGDVLAYLLSVS